MTRVPQPKSDPTSDPDRHPKHPNPTGPSGARQPPPLDDELDELPPLDGESEESPNAEDDETIADVDDDNPTESALDDSTGEDETPDARDLALDDGEKSWLDEATESPDLDLGDMPLDALAVRSERDSAIAPDEIDDQVPSDDETGVADLTPPGGLDSGDEGPIDEDDELRDEDLPALDADDDGEPEEAGFVDERFAANDPLGLPWAATPWARVGAPLGIFGATAIACAGHGAVVAAQTEANDGETDDDAGEGEPSGVSQSEDADDGDERSQLLYVDLEGEKRALAAAGLDGAPVVSLAASLAAHGAAGAEPELVAVVMKGGRAALSKDGGRSFDVEESLRPAAEAAIAAGVVWVRTRDGGIWRVGGGSAAAMGAASGAAAIATDGSKLAGLVLQEDRRPTAILVELGGGLAREPVVSRDARDMPESRVPPLFAVRASCAAYAGRTGIVRRGRDGAWKTFAWSGRVTSLAFVDDDGTLLAAVYLDTDDSTGLVRLDPAGNAAIVGRLGAPRNHCRADGRVLGMACDDARGVVWVAGGFGVAAFAIAR